MYIYIYIYIYNHSMHVIMVSPKSSLILISHSSYMYRRHRPLPIPCSSGTSPSCASRSSRVSSAQPPSSRPFHKRYAEGLPNRTTTLVSRLRPLRRLLWRQGPPSLFFLEMSITDPSSRSRRMPYEGQEMPSPCPLSKLNLKRMAVPLLLLPTL